jgi:hypothetical protein
MAYQIPFAADPARLLIGGFAAMFLLAIYGSWLPRAMRILHNLSGTSQSSAAASIGIAVAPLVIGLAPLLLAIALIRNPTTHVTDTGVSKENLFSPGSVSLGWSDIARVDCRSGRSGKVNTILMIANDGRRVGFRNTSADFAPVRELLVKRLGPAIARNCAR